jgi:hypothetical protein
VAAKNEKSKGAPPEQGASFFDSGIEAEERVRTSDPRFTKTVLYPLSYFSICDVLEKDGGPERI